MNATLLVRPIWNEEILKELASIVGNTLNEWCNDETDLEYCIESSTKVLRWSHNEDGYGLAKEFEDEGFSPDSELVELLDSVSYQKSQLVDVFVKKWVIENSLSLELKEGEKANFKSRKGIVEGEIVALYHETMNYGIWYESIGYKKGQGHAIVGFEKIFTS